MALALTVRLVIALETTYVVHPDELFQFYEQGHRLAFGSGVVPWEFHDGARSWLIPGIIAGIMRASRWVGSDPSYYIAAARSLCAVLSLSVVYVAFRTGLRRDGLAGACVTGIVAAIWLDPIYVAPSVMSEVMSSYCALWAIYLVDWQRRDTRTTVLIGALLSMAAALRLQYMPALLVIALWHCRLDWRGRWLALLAGGIAVIVLDLGVLDFLTWGAPFHSSWHYVLRAFFQGFADQDGTTGSMLAYARLVAWSWTGLAAPLALLVIIGCFRAPLLAAVAATVLVSHNLIGHKEYRYLCLALLITAMLMGLGAMYVHGKIRPWIGTVASRAVGTIFIAYVAFVSYFAWGNGLLFLQQTGGNLQLFLAAHREPQICGLAALDASFTVTGGYTYFDRDVPIYYATLDPVVTIESIGLLIPQSVELDRTDVPLYPGDEVLKHADRFNYLVASADRHVDGFTPVVCVRNGPLHSWARMCLYKRPGPCR
jgi:hypothetical protein